MMESHSANSLEIRGIDGFRVASDIRTHLDFPLAEYVFLERKSHKNQAIKKGLPKP